MLGLRSDIAIVGDGNPGAEDVASALKGTFNYNQARLNELKGTSDAPLTVFCANAGTDRTYARLKDAVANCNGEKIFVLPTHNSKSIDRVTELGATDYLVRPIDPLKLIALVKQALSRRVERSWATLPPASQAALKSSLASFQDCFARVQAGEPLPMETVQSSCRKVRESAEVGALGDWIDALDNHHNYSFRHSMFVCGTLTYFANAVGIKGSDLQLLTVGGMLHDVGKSQVPVAILDKAGQLAPDEWAIMRKHPEYSREILLREHGLDENATAMAVHHHEKLDGTGYPDGLAGAQITDYVRLMSIADVYAALIDKRSYKGAMTKEEAIDLMTTKFDGHLDMDLLRTFRDYMLDTK